ncbi:MAG TPA: FAD-dependent oxidoreductase, partial [Burkholderiales bacterium]|nr:FAD-dependent oxidoreductase [Burkholderiales bacterium]
MTRFDYDLFVIGAGSGGIRASRISHHLGAKVAIAENYRIGGTCVIRGCIPKKLLSYAAHYAEDLEDMRGFGWSIEGASFSWPALIANKNREIARLSAVYTDGFARVGVTMIEGTAKLVGRENVIAGADCGFSSQASYHTEVHPTVVWAKFEALREGARLA